MGKADSRRKFIQHSLCAGAVFLGSGLILNACGTKQATQENKEKAAKADPCEDFSGVSESEIKKREQLGYVKASPLPDNQCSNCNLWLPPKDGKVCGGCMLFQGPVYAKAYCTYWAPKV